MNTFYFGDRIRLAATFTDLSGNLFNPTGITLQITAPSGVSEAFTYPAPGVIVNDSTGAFHYDWLSDMIGNLEVLWISTEVGAEKSEPMQLLIQSART